jgi:hypothetical protein
VQLHVDKEIHVVLDNLSTHTTPGGSGLAGEEPARHVSLHAGRVVVAQPNRDLVRGHHSPGDQAWNLHLGAHPHPANNRLHQHVARRPETLQLVATADEILAKVKVVEANVRTLIDNNAK